ncbi:MAG TPA: type III PLP-dependent enzyme [Limnobacter sp.]|nr:type III PLP-dependent enzyme [Limnobacter sp.]
MNTTLIDFLDSRPVDEHNPWCAYVYDLTSLASHAQRLSKALPRNCELFYAIKANPDVTLLRTLLPHVNGFEAASSGELAHLRANGIDKPILMGGPGKTNADISYALEQCVACMHVESITELQRLIVQCASTQRIQPVLLRLNINLQGIEGSKLQMGGGASPFGMDESDLPEAIRLIQSTPWILFQGFHFHSMSHQLSVTKHLELIRHYFKVVAHWERQCGLQVNIVNVGGGIGVNYKDVDAQFDWESFCQQLHTLIETSGYSQKTIRFECGRYVTAFCGYYVMQVIDIKRSHGQWFAVCRGGTHHFRTPSAQNHDHPALVHHRAGPTVLQRDVVNLVGQLCTPKDKLHTGLYVDRLALNDLVVFPMAGAYAWNISHQQFLMHTAPEMFYLTQGPASA